jgi:hypothetical protein
MRAFDSSGSRERDRIYLALQALTRFLVHSFSDPGTFARVGIERKHCLAPAFRTVYNSVDVIEGFQRTFAPAWLASRVGVISGLWSLGLP